MREVRKIGTIIDVSQEELDYQLNLLKEIALAPARRVRRLAEETYWVNDETLDNPCVQRGEN